VWNLNLSEAAFLAGLPQSPTKFSPFGQDPSEAFVRQREVLRLMRVNKYISEEEQIQSSNQRITFIPKKDRDQSAPFVMMSEISWSTNTEKRW